MRISGVAALVTGGGSGMGAATARHLASLGARVGVLDHNAEAAGRVAAEFGGIGIGCDVTDEAAVIRALDLVRDAYGEARIVVNCAGVAGSGTTLKRDGGTMDIAAFRRVVDINLTGTWNVMRLAAARLARLEPDADGERGVMVNTASIAGLDSPPDAAGYVAAKAGVAALSLAMAREFAPQGIRVMAIAPGLMDTPMLAGIKREYRETMVAHVPFPRRFGRPEEFARLVGEICANQMLNGSTIRLDGGLHAFA